MNKSSKVTSLLLMIFIIIKGIFDYLTSYNPDTLYICFIGAVVIAVSYKISTKDKNSAYLYIATISLVLACFFGINFAKDATSVVDGATLLVSATSFAVVGLSWLNRHKEIQEKEE